MTSSHALIIPILCLSCAGETLAPLENDPDGTAVVGRVLHPDGRPAQARVFLVRDGVGDVAVYTDADGMFTLEMAPAGSAELMAHAGADGAALLEVDLHGRGRNRVEDMVLRPFGEFPRLIDYVGVDFEERLTRADGTHSAATFEQSGRPSGPAHLDLVRYLDGRVQLVNFDLERGEADVLTEFPGGVLPIHGRIGARYTGFNGEFEMTRLATGEVVATLSSIAHSQLGPSAFVSSGGSLVFEDRRFASVDDVVEIRFLRIGETDAELSEPILREEVTIGLQYLGQHGDQLLVAPMADCRDIGCAGTFQTIHAVHLDTLAVDPWMEVATIDPEMPAVMGASSLHVARRFGPSEWVVSSIDLQTQDAQNSETITTADAVEVIGEHQDRAIVLVTDRNQQTLGVIEVDGRFRQLLQAPELEIRSQNGARLAVLQEAPELRFWMVDVETGELQSERLEGFCVTQCYDFMLEDELLVIRGARDGAGRYQIEAFDIRFGAPTERRTWASTQPPTSRLTRFGALEVVSRLDREGRDQFFVGGAGQSLDAFVQQTFLGSRGRTVLRVDEEKRLLYYLATDPLTGRRQLFRRSF